MFALRKDLVDKARLMYMLHTLETRTLIVLLRQISLVMKTMLIVDTPIKPDSFGIFIGKLVYVVSADAIIYILL